jgi:hypothetical protein
LFLLSRSQHAHNHKHEFRLRGWKVLAEKPPASYVSPEVSTSIYSQSNVYSSSFDGHFTSLGIWRWILNSLIAYTQKLVGSNNHILLPIFRTSATVGGLVVLSVGLTGFFSPIALTE